jgi:hypothetical protein
MDHLYLNNDVGWILIFYTGKERLTRVIENHVSANTILIKRRPDLYTLIPNIIYGIESGLGMPESMEPSKYFIRVKFDTNENSRCLTFVRSGEKSRVKGMIADKVRELEESSLNEDEIIEELTILAHESGFLLSNMISEDDQTSGTSLLEAVKEHFSLHQPRFRQHYDSRNSHIERVRRRRSRQGSYMGTISNMKVTGYCPWENQEGAHEFVKGLGKSSVVNFLLHSLSHYNSHLPLFLLDPKLVLSTWGMMYCGGSSQIEDTLKNISKTYSIDLHPESFAW